MMMGKDDKENGDSTSDVDCDGDSSGADNSDSDGRDGGCESRDDNGDGDGDDEGNGDTGGSINSCKASLPDFRKSSRESSYAQGQSLFEL